MSKDTAYEVRFGALIAASARAMQAAWAAVLLVWVTRSLLEATTPILRARVNAETGYHQVRRGLQDRLIQIAISSLATTLSTVVLAQIYAQRVRGIELPGSSSASPATAAA